MCGEVEKSGRKALGQQMAESARGVCDPEVQGHPDEPQPYPLFANTGQGLA